MITKIQNLIREASGVDEFSLEVPEHEQFGHFSTNVAMQVAASQKKKPHDVAREIVGEVCERDTEGLLERIEVAGPGFINFWVQTSAWQEEFSHIAGDESYGTLDVLKGKRVMVEYTDPNPFKQFHIGHLMTNIIGEAIARLHEAAGAEVLRVNYQGDVGLHVAKSIWGMLRASDEMPKEDASLAEKTAFLGKAYAAGSRGYDDERTKQEIDALNKKVYERSDAAINELYDRGRAWSLEYFEAIYARLGTKFVHYFFESEVGPEGVSLVRSHPEVFIESQGATIFPGERQGLHNRVFISSLGLPTYEAKELGLNKKKFDLFSPDTSLIITCNEIKEYFEVLHAAMERVIPHVAARTKHLGHGMLRLPSGKMSSRTGEVILGEWLIDEVRALVSRKIEEREGLDEREREHIQEKVALAAIRYSILRQGIGKDIIFDFEKSIAFQGDSGPYLQYTYARMESLLRKAGERRGAADTRQLTADAELALIRVLTYVPHAVRLATETLEPNVLVRHCGNLANAMNRFYEAAPILTDENEDRRGARLSLCETSARILGRGLAMLGIETLEKM